MYRGKKGFFSGIGFFEGTRNKLSYDTADDICHTAVLAEIKPQILRNDIKKWNPHKNKIYSLVKGIYSGTSIITRLLNCTCRILFGFVGEILSSRLFALK